MRAKESEVKKKFVRIYGVGAWNFSGDARLSEGLLGDNPRQRIDWVSPA
jgi:hypothetical protein